MNSFLWIHSNFSVFDGSLWLYAIHSNNPDFLVNYIQAYNIEPIDKTYEETLMESIKCNHNHFANYILDNLIDKDLKNQQNTTDDKMTFDERLFDVTLKYHNYSFISNLFNQNNSFFYFCKYNHQYIVDLLIQLHKDDIEAKII